MSSNRTNNKITILKNLRKAKEIFKDYDIVKYEDNTFIINDKEGNSILGNIGRTYTRLDISNELLEHRLKIIKRYIDRNE